MWPHPDTPPWEASARTMGRRTALLARHPSLALTSAVAPCVTFHLVVVSLRGPGQSPVLPFACCVGSLLSVGRCGRCSCCRPPPPPELLLAALPTVADWLASFPHQRHDPSFWTTPPLHVGSCWTAFWDVNPLDNEAVGAMASHTAAVKGVLTASCHCAEWGRFRTARAQHGHSTND